MVKKGEMGNCLCKKKPVVDRNTAFVDNEDTATLDVASIVKEEPSGGVLPASEAQSQMADREKPETLKVKQTETIVRKVMNPFPKWDGVGLQSLLEVLEVDKMGELRFPAQERTCDLSKNM